MLPSLVWLADMMPLPRRTCGRIPASSSTTTRTTLPIRTRVIHVGTWRDVNLGVTPQEIDVFSLYDPVSFEIIRQFEMLGLCGEGEGGAFIENGRLSLGGQCPTNLDGGMLAGSWTGTGQLTLKVIEGVRQLRRTCGARQVQDAELALVTNAGSGAQHVEMVVLGRN